MSGSISGTASANMGLIRDALKSGDVMTVMQMLGIERASTLEDVVKGKVSDIERRNAEVQKLNGIMAQLSVEDKDGTVITNDAASAKDMAKFFADNPEIRDKTHSGINFYNSAGKEIHPVTSANYSEVTSVKVQHANGQKLETVKTVLDAEIKRLTSDDQLAMIELQSMISKHNNAMELASSMTKKESDLNGTIIRNMG